MLQNARCALFARTKAFPLRCEELRDQVTQRRSGRFYKRGPHRKDQAIGLHFVGRMERGRPVDELEYQYAEPPPINRPRMALLANDFRGHVIRRPANGPGLAFDDFGKAQINHFEIPLLVEDDCRTTAVRDVSVSSRWDGINQKDRCNLRFSGFTSRWMMKLSWMHWRANTS